MKSTLLRQLAAQTQLTLKQAYIRIYGLKSPRVLNQVIPDVYSNLLNSSEQFVNGLVDLDQQYIKQITTPSLQKILIPQMQKLRQQQVKIRKQPISQKQLKKNTNKNQDPLSDLVRFTVSPYVIFGQSMQDRLKQQNPWKNLINLFSLNRFIYYKDAFNFQKIKDNQIYGFNCYYTNLSKEIHVIKKQEKQKYQPKNLVISFETDAVNHQFYVSDFNFLVRQNTIKQQL